MFRSTSTSKSPTPSKRHGNHHASSDHYIPNKISREHKCRQSLYTPIDKADTFCANTGLPMFQILLDKDGDVLLYSNDGDHSQLFSADVNQVLGTTVAEILSLMMNSAARKSEKENKRITKEADKLLAKGEIDIPTKNQMIDENKNDNKILGENLLILGPDTVPENRDGKKNPRRKTDYTHAKVRKLYVKQGVVHNLNDYLSCERKGSWDFEDQTAKIMESTDDDNSLRKRSMPSEIDAEINDERDNSLFEDSVMSVSESDAKPAKKLVVCENGCQKPVLKGHENPLPNSAFKPCADFKNKESPRTKLGLAVPDVQGDYFMSNFGPCQQSFPELMRQKNLVSPKISEQQLFAAQLQL